MLGSLVCSHDDPSNIGALVVRRGFGLLHRKSIIRNTSEVDFII